MIQLFKHVNIDWLGKRRFFISVSIVLLLVGMSSALYRHRFHPNGTDAFNLGVDFKGGTVVTVRFRQPPPVEAIRAAVDKAGVKDAVIQPILDKAGGFLIRLPKQAAVESAATSSEAGVDVGRSKVQQALNTFGREATKDLNTEPEAAYKIEGTDAVGEVAGKELRSRAITVTIAALVGMLIFIAFRFEWAYGAAAVIAVFHTVLVTLGLFSIFQWEINLTVIAALLTLVGFDVNDSIVVFDRIRENLKLHRRMSLYDVTNLSINQTLSRTVITSGLVFLSVIAMVLFGGETLRPFSLALLMGIVFGTYDSIAIASPIMVWWQKRLEVSNRGLAVASRQAESPSGTRAGAATPKRQPAVRPNPKPRQRAGQA
jgi:preprotein translocase subunit SecF